MVALIALISYLTQLNNDSVKTISVLDESGLFADEFKSTGNTKYDILLNLDLEDAKKLVREAENYGLLYIPKADNVDELSDKIKFFSEDSPSLLVMDRIEDKIEEKARNIKLKESGFDPVIDTKIRCKY